MTFQEISTITLCYPGRFHEYVPDPLPVGVNSGRSLAPKMMFSYPSGKISDSSLLLFPLTVISFSVMDSQNRQPGPLSAIFCSLRKRSASPRVLA